MPVPPLPPIRVREVDGAPNVIPVFEIVVSNNTLQDLGGGSVSIGVPSGGSGASTANSYITWQTEAALSAEKVLTAGSSVVIHTDATAVYVDATTATPVVYAATGNTYVVVSNAGDLTADRALAAGTGLVLVDGGANSTMSVAVSNRTVYLPMALVTVQPDSANAFWMSTNNATIDQGFVRYVDGGEGISTWATVVPANLWGTPAWNLQYYCLSNTAAASNVVVTARARQVGNGSPMDGAYTLLSSAAVITLFAINTLNIVAASGGTFDAPLALTSTAWLYVEVNRHGGNAADTVTSAWDLYGVALRADVR